MATNWVNVQKVSNENTSGTTVVGTISKPSSGDLLVVGGDASAVGTPTTLTISDNSSGGASWTAFSGAPFSNSGNTSLTGGWWKIANATDAANLTAITLTQNGTVSIRINTITVEEYSVTGGGTIGIDLVGHSGSASPVSTISFSPASGSAQSTNTDELAWAFVAAPGASSMGAPTGTNTFTGTSSAAAFNNGATTNENYILSRYVGGVQASATAGTNVWKLTWTTAENCDSVGATFYYTAVAPSYLPTPRCSNVSVMRAATR